MPKISVVMPEYNTNPVYLTEAIESILNQTFTDFEFIIVKEFGSDEASTNVCRSFAEKDKRIRLIENTERLGISESLNVGLRASNGEYIARMDADDISGSRRLEVQNMFMDFYKDIGICGIFPTIINSPNWIVDFETDPELVKSSVLFMMPIRHPTIIIRNEALRHAGVFYDKNLHGAEDYDFFNKCRHVIKMTNINEPKIFYYRRYLGNKSDVYKESDNVIQKHLFLNLYMEDLNIRLSDIQQEVLSSLTQFIDDTKINLEMLKSLEVLFRDVIKINENKKLYMDYALRKTMKNKWRKVVTLMKNAYVEKGGLPYELRQLYENSEFFSR